MGEIADELIDRMWDRMGDPDFDEQEGDWYLPLWRRIPTKRKRSPPPSKADEFEVNE